ncbi:unnamed protein product [Anisakis simplex]|uniref:DUF599 domain-containing protein n=1 Tax=Anisakis simplex TaxID=6269 RepID=A0A158PPB6_ANISI|nr:unnamed protein product [Anisakis simplex]
MKLIPYDQCQYCRASSSLVLTMFQAQGFANLLFLIYWDRQNVAEAIRRSLNSSSTGIGVLRRRNTLNNIQVASMLCGCILSLLLVCFTVVQLFTIHSSASVDQHQQSEHHYQQIYLKWARLCVFVYLSISFPAAYAQIATFTGIISAEYKSLNDDFMEDVNTYQLPVAKHYVSAHWKLGNTFNLYQRSLSLWMSVHLMTSFASLAFIWISVPSVRSILQQFESSIEIQRVFELTFGFVLLLLTILTIIALVIVSLLVRFHSTRMRHSMIALIASDRILHEQTYSLAIAYINHLHRRGLGIMFFEIALIDRHFIIKVRELCYCPVIGRQRYWRHNLLSRSAILNWHNAGIHKLWFVCRRITSLINEAASE